MATVARLHSQTLITSRMLLKKRLMVPYQRAFTTSGENRTLFVSSLTDFIKNLTVNKHRVASEVYVKDRLEDARLFVGIQGKKPKSLAWDLEAASKVYKRSEIHVIENFNGMHYYIPIAGIPKEFVVFERRGKINILISRKLEVQEMERDLSIEIVLPEPVEEDYTCGDIKAIFKKNGILLITVTGYKNMVKDDVHVKPKEQSESESESVLE